MSAELLTASIFSVPVLAFALGVIAASIKADLSLPDSVYQALSIYLLLAIGIKGGVALRGQSLSDIVIPLGATIGLGLVIPLLAFFVLKVMTNLSRVNRGAMAAHYGSTSLVTFTVAIVYLESMSVAYEGYVTTLLAVMEVPGILVGLLLAGKQTSQTNWGSATREVFTSRSIVLLVGGLLIGALTGVGGYLQVEPLFGALFTGVLALFLLEMGVLAGRRIKSIKEAGWGLLAFALLFPLLAGVIGIFVGAGIGLSQGGAMILGVLSASASYIAAPAAVRLALPTANPGITLTASLGITFPFNLVLGIPIYWAITQAVIA
jgi:hypothetical protein